MSAVENEFERMLDMLADLRGEIDKIDETSFGRLGTLFDKLARDTDAVISVAKELDAKIDWQAETGVGI